MQDEWYDTPAGQERARCEAEIERLRAEVRDLRATLAETAPPIAAVPVHVSLAPRGTDFRFRGPVRRNVPSSTKRVAPERRHYPRDVWNQCVPVLHEVPFGWHAHADRSELDASLELAPFSHSPHDGVASSVQQRGTQALKEAFCDLSGLAHAWRTRVVQKGEP